jgi:hypothetical protein
MLRLRSSQLSYETFDDLQIFPRHRNKKLIFGVFCKSYWNAPLLVALSMTVAYNACLKKFLLLGNFFGAGLGHVHGSLQGFKVAGGGQFRLL